MNKLKTNVFLTTVITFIVTYLVIKVVIPFLSRKITGMPFPLPVPGTLVLFYIVLTIIALFLYATFSEERLKEFKIPIEKFLSGDYGTRIRNIVLAGIPLIAGWQVYDFTVPKAAPPISLRIQHPSSNFPKNMETLKNPLENPSDESINSFIEQAKQGNIEFISQVSEDVKIWKEKNPDKHTLSFIPTEPVMKFINELKTGNASKETAKSALHEKNLFEGRALYAMNCRPCHGDSAAGDGPMADGFKLRPINFTDNGTIETIVEGYTFWRVATGGIGLPQEATPWDSAMPVWKLNLTDEERWKIIMAEYDLAQKTPRIPERH